MNRRQKPQRRDCKKLDSNTCHGEGLSVWVHSESRTISSDGTESKKLAPEPPNEAIPTLKVLRRVLAASSAAEMPKATRPKRKSVIDVTASPPMARYNLGIENR